jgi:hypothetical protein
MSSVNGLYRRKCLHFSSLLILFGDLRGTDRCIDISTVRWENFDARRQLQYLNTFWQLAATHYSDWALKENTQQPSLFASIHLQQNDIHYFLGIYISSTLFVILLSYLPSYTLFNFYLILPTFNFFSHFTILFFHFLFSSLFLPFEFTVSLLVISFRLLRHSRFLSIATYVLPLISYVVYNYKTKLYHNALIFMLFRMTNKIFL